MGVVGLIVKPDLLILWVALIAFGVAPIPQALIERFPTAIAADDSTRQRPALMVIEARADLRLGHAQTMTPR